MPVVLFESGGVSSYDPERSTTVDPSTYDHGRAFRWIRNNVKGYQVVRSKGVQVYQVRGLTDNHTAKTNKRRVRRLKALQV